MMEKVYNYIEEKKIENIMKGEEGSPRDLMCPRLTKDGVLIQGFFPEQDRVEVIAGRKTYEMLQISKEGYYAALIPSDKLIRYFLRTKKGDTIKEFSDPYAFECQITEEEEKAFCAGIYYDSYKKLGAHPMILNGTQGTLFAVWAPNAVRVSLVGDFNHWDGRRTLLHRMPRSGIFELFVPGVHSGALYKYEIKTKTGEILLKNDPYAFMSEHILPGASVVTDLHEFTWEDDLWMKDRKKYQKKLFPISIFETNLLEWKNKEELVRYVKDLGYTHVELTPVMEYMDENSGGYSTFSYYAPTSRFGSPGKMQQLINELHKENIGVILDWTPAQFPACEGGLESFDGTELYEKKIKEEKYHPLWGTLLYDYGSPMVKNFLISSACFWTEIYHADGIRMDDVDAILYLDYHRENWTSNYYGTNENLQAVEFLKHLNSILRKRNPGVFTIAQEEGAWPQLTGKIEDDHVGFDYKWNRGWTKDFLEYLAVPAKERCEHHDQLTLSMLYAYCEKSILTLGKRDVTDIAGFLEKIAGTTKEKEAQLRAAYAYMMLHPGGCMMAPGNKISDDLRRYILDLNDVYKNRPALYQKDHEYEGFEWIQLMKYEERILAFLRKTDREEETILAICNFSGVPQEEYMVGVPFLGKFKEIFNSDQKEYGGEEMTNPRVRTSKNESCDEREYSIKVRIPAYGVTVLLGTPDKAIKKKKVLAFS